MSHLSFKEFLKLSEEEKCERYEELSEHHKFLARISQNVGTRVIPEEDMTEDEREQLRRMKKMLKLKNLKNGKKDSMLC